MKDPITKLVQDLVAQGVVFYVVGGDLRWQAPCGVVGYETARLLADYAPIVIALLQPDLTLPDELIIPVDTLNDIASLTACIDAQRVA